MAQQRGTVPIREFSSRFGAGPLELTNVSGTLFFTADSGRGGTLTYDRELWTSDGTTSGTVLVRDINRDTYFPYVDSSPSRPDSLVNVGGTLFFSADDGDYGRELWKSDGTTDGTLLVKDIDSDIRYCYYCQDDDGQYGDSSNPSGLTNVGGTLFFRANDGFGYRLWKSDGTATGTVDLGAVAPSYIQDLGGVAIFAAQDGTNGRELWSSDGTLSGTDVLADINIGYGDSTPKFLTSLGDVVYFQADDGSSGNELWLSDGTGGGTRRVADVNSTGDSQPNDFTRVEDMVFFTADDGQSGVELWRTDGTEANTMRVRDIRPGSENSEISELTNFAGRLVFAANDGGTDGGAVWESDGSLAGTNTFKNPPSNSAPNQLTEVNGILYFAAKDGVSGEPTLWRTDGTASGTSQLLFEGDPIQDPTNLTRLQDDLVFFAGGDLFRSDGTSAGTQQIGSFSGGTDYLTNFNGTLIFSARGSQGVELWKSNGLAGGTEIIKDINTGYYNTEPNSSFPKGLTNTGGVVYFNANGGVGSLWKTDGTSEGTAPTGLGFSREILPDESNRVFFSIGELWMSQGGMAPEEVKDIRPGTDSSEPQDLTMVDGTLYFGANDGSNGYELWKSDGTEAGTVLVKDINPAGSSTPSHLANVDGLLYFAADEGVNGYELWTSDGTAAGTIKVTEINPSGSAGPSALINLGGNLFFSATDGINGYELWRSDGTAAGTKMVADVNGDPLLSSYPSELTPFDGQLFMAARDDVTGIELWTASLAGDFIQNGQLDLADIDALVAEIVAGTHQPAFDLTSDNLVNLDDLNRWLDLAGNCNLGFGRSYLPGDANLSGIVDFLDFNIWASNRFTSNAAWSKGDFNASGIVDFLDFNIWATYRFQSSFGLAPPPTPEKTLDELPAVHPAAVPVDTTDRVVPSLRSEAWQQDELATRRRHIQQHRSRLEQTIDDFWAKEAT